jgi:hypothetical protein
MRFDLSPLQQDLVNQLGSFHVAAKGARIKKVQQIGPSELSQLFLFGGHASDFLFLGVGDGGAAELVAASADRLDIERPAVVAVVVVPRRLGTVDAWEFRCTRHVAAPDGRRDGLMGQIGTVVFVSLLGAREAESDNWRMPVELAAASFTDSGRHSGRLRCLPLGRGVALDDKFAQLESRVGCVSDLASLPAREPRLRDAGASEDFALREVVLNPQPHEQAPGFALVFGHGM